MCWNLLRCMGRVSALADKAPQQSFTGGGDGETGGTSRKLSVTSERRRLLTNKDSTPTRNTIAIAYSLGLSTHYMKDKFSLGRCCVHHFHNFYVHHVILGNKRSRSDAPSQARRSMDGPDLWEEVASMRSTSKTLHFVLTTEK